MFSKSAIGLSPALPPRVQNRKWVEYFLTTCGTALEGGPMPWVATHRVHHQLTNVEGDPHSRATGGLLGRTWVRIITGRAITKRELLHFVPDPFARYFIHELRSSIGFQSRRLSILGDWWITSCLLGIVFAHGLTSERGGEFRDAYVVFAAVLTNDVEIVFGSVLTFGERAQHHHAACAGGAYGIGVYGSTSTGMNLRAEGARPGVM